MEDLSEATQSGLVFGPGSPLNWGKDLDSLTARCRASGLDVKAVTTLAFEAAATLHAPYWNNTSELAKHSWLRGAGWLQGEGEQAWRGYQAHAAGAWARAKDKMKKTGSSDGEAAAVTWDPFVVSCVDNAVAAASSEGSWASFRASMASFPLTLTHGDFHPANMMIVLSPGTEGGDPAGKSATSGPDPTAPAPPPPGGGVGAEAAGGSGASIVLLDFEQVGVGSGPQDLGQYLISHASPEDRRALEAQGILRVYYDKLCSLNPAVPATLTFEQCEAEYVQGGAGRWLWFLPVLDSMCPPKMTQYFHDQTAAFMKDHGITPETVPLPRV